jgi:glycosyltransferase involved in cell wall biosynthesis
MRPYNSSDLKKILYSFFFNNTEVIFLSNILIKDFNFNTFKNCKIHILPNFINGIKDTNLSNRTFITDINNDNVKILYLGHMIESKGFKRALVIANKICKNHPNFIFNFYGNFFDNKNLIFFNKYLRDNDLCKNVNFLGFCSNEQKKDVFFHNNLLIMPSYSEAFPLVLMESLLNGLPVVATNTGAVEEIVKEYGTLIDDINEEEIYIEQFISGIFDTIKNFNLTKSIASSEYINTKFNYDLFKENLLLIFKKE